MLKIMATLGVLLLTVGCASVLTEDQQVVAVRAVCHGVSLPAQCVAENSRGRWAFVTPAQVWVRKDVYDLRVSCSSTFVGRQSVSVRPGLQLAMAGNVLLGGLVGGAVDVATARGLQYPSQLDVVFPSCQ